MSKPEAWSGQSGQQGEAAKARGLSMWTDQGSQGAQTRGQGQGQQAADESRR